MHLYTSGKEKIAALIGENVKRTHGKKKKKKRKPPIILKQEETQRDPYQEEVKVKLVNYDTDGLSKNILPTKRSRKKSALKDPDSL